VEVKIVWVSGHFSVAALTPPIHRQADVSRYDELVARIQALEQDGHKDAEIAEFLTREGFHAARNPHVSVATVVKIRHQQGRVSDYHRHRLADKIDGHWTIHGLSKELGIDRNWFYRRIYNGTLQEPDVLRQPAYGTYLIRDDPALIERLRREVHELRQQRAKSHS
jgi:hypothetical protein